MATRQQLESFIDNHVDAIVIYNKNLEVLRVNPAFEKTFGWTAAELVNRHLMDLPYIPNELKNQINDEVELVKLGHSFHTDDTQRIKKNGETLDILITGFPIYNSHHEFNGCSVVLRDITEWNIPEEVLSKIGQPFFTTKPTGTGLGFMVSKKIIENHKGLVHINSQVNKGTEIELIIPRF